jgi:hypothetical protein
MTRSNDAMTTPTASDGSRIPLAHRGKRPRFFDSTGSDELMSMVLELTAEMWVMRKRLYLLERVADRAGLPLTEGIETLELGPDEAAELDRRQRQMLANVLRSLAVEPTERARVRSDMEALGAGSAPAERVA